MARQQAAELPFAHLVGRYVEEKICTPTRIQRQLGAPRDVKAAVRNRATDLDADEEILLESFAGSPRQAVQLTPDQ